MKPVSTVGGWDATCGELWSSYSICGAVPVSGGSGAAGNRSSFCPSPRGPLSLRQPESGVSGGVCGNGTHRGDKGGALRVSVQGVREGLSEEV